jgi:Asp-tRNA(Asn)/Glu-tRNA(Gln) amidotransferase C subunit
MAISFTLSNGKLVLDPKLAMIEEFTNILEYGEKKGNKDLGSRMLLYIFYCCDLTNNNPMKDVDYREKERQAMARALGPIKKTKFTKKETELINEGLDAYNYFNEDALERSANVQQRKIDEISDLLDKTKPFIDLVHDIDTGEIDKVVTNQKAIEGFVKQLESLAVGMLKAKETAKKVENVGRVRGDKGSSMIERGVFRDAADKNLN